jgi:surface antigen
MNPNELLKQNPDLALKGDNRSFRGDVWDRDYQEQCTTYASTRRVDLGMPLKADGRWGGGGNWAIKALADGYEVKSTPSLGAVAVDESLGHVMIVEQVNSDGSIVVSEANYTLDFDGSFGVRKVSAEQAKTYKYIP